MGIASIHLVKRSVTTRRHLFPVTERGYIPAVMYQRSWYVPIKSNATVSQGPRDARGLIVSAFAVRAGLLQIHRCQELTYFHTVPLIPGQ